MEASMSLERRKNEHLHCLLSKLEGGSGVSSSSPTNDDQLARTYRKSLADCNEANKQLELQTASASKTANELRECLNAKEAEATLLEQRLKAFTLDVAQKSSFANGKALDAERVLEEAEGQDLGEDIERERLRHIENKLQVSRLEQQLRKKNSTSGGVSDAEYSNLEASIKATESKIEVYEEDLRRMHADGDKLRKTEAFLTKAVQDYAGKNATKEIELAELNGEIEEKQNELDRLKTRIGVAKKKVGYDASDLDAFLQTKAVNSDFESSKGQLEALRAKLNGLVLQHSALKEQSRE